MKVKMKKLCYVCLPLFILTTSITSTNIVTWGPTVGDFRITHFVDFGVIEDQIEHSITITCLEGGGSSYIEFKTNLPIHLTPTVGMKSLQKGESYTDTYTIKNPFGHPEVEGYINATIYNTLGTPTDTKTAYGTLAFNDYEPEESQQTQETNTPNEKQISLTAIVIIGLMAIIGILIGILVEKRKNKKPEKITE